MQTAERIDGTTASYKDSSSVQDQTLLQVARELHATIKHHDPLSKVQSAQSKVLSTESVNLQSLATIQDPSAPPSAATLFVSQDEKKNESSTKGACPRSPEKATEQAFPRLG